MAISALCLGLVRPLLESPDNTCDELPEKRVLNVTRHAFGEMLLSVINNE